MAQVLQQQEALLTGLLLLAQSVCQNTAGAQLLLRWGLMSQLSELARWLLERVLDAGVEMRSHVSNTCSDVQDSCGAILNVHCPAGSCCLFACFQISRSSGARRHRPP